MSRLSTLLRDERDAIVADWMSRVSRLPEAEGIPDLLLRDNMPGLLDEIATRLERMGEPDGGEGLPSLHALERYRIGFDIRGVLAEYRVLRQVILERAGSGDGDHASVAFLHDLLDRAISDAVDQFAFERDRGREIFVGMLGHDLRSPLGAITMAAQAMLVQAELLEPAHRRLSKRILASARKIERMADDLLDFTRGRIGGGVPLMVASTDLAAVVRDVAEELNEAFPDRTIRAVIDGHDLRGDWDGDRLSQVVSNLISNALEHGGDPIEVDARPDGDRVVIEVRNQGELPPDAISRVFDPFVSLAATRAGRRGLGLGLYIVREIARAHGGTVEASSEDGATAFRVLLPRQAQPPQ